MNSAIPMAIGTAITIASSEMITVTQSMSNTPKCSDSAVDAPVPGEQEVGLVVRDGRHGLDDQEDRDQRDQDDDERAGPGGDAVEESVAEARPACVACPAPPTRRRTPAARPRACSRPAAAPSRSPLVLSTSTLIRRCRLHRLTPYSRWRQRRAGGTGLRRVCRDFSIYHARSRLSAWSRGGAPPGPPG